MKRCCGNCDFQEINFLLKKLDKSGQHMHSWDILVSCNKGILKNVYVGSHVGKIPREKLRDMIFANPKMAACEKYKKLKGLK